MLEVVDVKIKLPGFAARVVTARVVSSSRSEAAQGQTVRQLEELVASRRPGDEPTADVKAKAEARRSLA